MALTEFTKELTHIEILQNEPLSRYTYTKTGGNCDVIAFPKTIAEVIEIVGEARQHQVPLTVLGNASNLIVRDGGIRGVTMILTKLNTIRVQGTQVFAASGAALIDVSRQAANHRLTGLEFACGIPGSIGGAVYMNAGAYGGEVKDVIVSVDVLTRDGELKQYRSQEASFSYRSSLFQKNGDVILGAYFQLQQGEESEIENKMAELTELRESKQPLEYPSCGSVFKRPEGYFAGKLIQDANLQGYRIGGVEVSTKHAGFMVNIDNGTATDYVHLIEYVQKEVFEKFGVALEPEVKIIGEELETTL